MNKKNQNTFGIMIVTDKKVSITLYTLKSESWSQKVQIEVKQKVERANYTVSLYVFLTAQHVIPYIGWISDSQYLQDDSFKNPYTTRYTHMYI